MILGEYLKIEFLCPSYNNPQSNTSYTAGVVEFALLMHFALFQRF